MSFPELATEADELVSHVAAALEAMERREAGAEAEMAIALLDLHIFTTGLTRDMFFAQADSLPATDPESYWRRAFGHAQDGLVALYAVERANVAGQETDRESAAQRMTAAAQSVRLQAELGRLTANTMTAQIAAAPRQSAEREALRARLLAELGEYSASFDRQLGLASILDGQVFLLRNHHRPYSAIAPELAAHVRRFIDLAIVLSDDQQKRTEILREGDEDGQTRASPRPPEEI